MSVATQVTTFLDLYTDLLNRVRDETDVTATSNIAKRWINTALYDMHMGFGETFPWTERRAVLRTHAQYTTGTITATQASVTLTGASTLWNTNDADGVANARVGGKIVLSDGANVFEVSAVVSDTEITLVTAPTEDVAAGGSYRYFEDEYALASDFLRPIDARSFSDGGEVELISRVEFRRRYVRNHTPGRPRVATLLDLPPSGNVTPVRKVAFHPPPSSVYLIPYTYVTSNLAVSSAGVAQVGLVADADEPIVPIGYRHAIVLKALESWYRDRKDDTRSVEVKAEYVEAISRIASDTEIGSKRPSIRPRIGPYWAHARRPYRGAGMRRYDINGRFDRMVD